MCFSLRPVDLAFLEHAGRTWVMESVVAAPPNAVWAAIADPTTWSHWFPGVQSARYAGAPPHGVGTRREATVNGLRYEETMVAWEEPRLWAYRIERATIPIAGAQLECTELEACNGGTRVRWTLAADRRLLLWLASPFLQRHLDGLWQRAMGNLETFLQQSARDGA